MPGFGIVVTVRVGFARRAAALALLMIAGGSGCSDGGVGPGIGHEVATGVRAVAGANASDTVQAWLAQALLVEVGGVDSQAAIGTVVRFEALPHGVAGRSAGEPSVTLSPVDRSAETRFMSDTTDARGRAMVMVRLGGVAGVMKVQLSVPEFGYRDTVSFTVHPGAAARIAMPVRDTAVFGGAAYSLGASVADRFGNARSDYALTYTPSGSIASVSAAGLAKAGSVGRGKIVITAGAFRDSAYASVVPTATIVVVEATSTERWVSTMLLDGSQKQRLMKTSHDALLPAWHPSGEHVVFHEWSAFEDAEIATVTLTGQRTVLLPTTSGEARGPAQARYSREGDWLYFAAKKGGTNGPRLWRRAAGGGTPELLPGQTSTDPWASWNHQQPDPSPDGSQLVFVKSGQIATMDIATGAITSLGGLGMLPRFSPDGTRIAFINNVKLKVMDANSTNVRVLADSRDWDWSGVSWSPDGEWIISRGWSTGLDIVRVSDGLRLPLPYSRTMHQPSFLP